jgi:beta-xylosidase
MEILAAPFLATRDGDSLCKINSLRGFRAFSNNGFMKKLWTQVWLWPLFLLISCSQKQVIQKIPSPALPSSVARLAGDYPDPSVIRVENSYFAATTTSNWAPAFSILTSKDLTNWDAAGSVFPEIPTWSDGNYWAPEIAHMGNTFFVYYSAKNKRTQGMCVAVATAPSPLGPYKDHGPLVCEKVGSIDASPVVDEKGDKYLFWKEDGNSQNKPTPIHVQKLSEDGTKLIGPRTDTIINDSPWEKKLVEAPFVLKRNKYWYMFYAGSDCCGRECSYAVGVARAESLLGPWQKNPANPILASNDSWKCPGHGSVVSDAQGRDVFLYHAYNAKEFNDVGRQLQADGIDWNSETGWPSINNGLGAGLNLNGTLKAPVKKEVLSFVDDFSSKALSPEWQWPYNHLPQFKLNPAKKQLTLTGKGSFPMGALLAKMTTHGNAAVTAVVNQAQQKKSVMAGLAAVGNLNNAVGIYLQNGKIQLWQIQGGKLSNLATTKLMSDPTARAPALVYLKIALRDGHFFRFSASANGQTWAEVGSEVDGAFLPPWDLGIRAALTAGNGSAVFNAFSMESLVQ